MGSYAARVKNQLDTANRRIKTLEEQLVDQQAHLEHLSRRAIALGDDAQAMGEVLSEVCHTLLSPRDDGNFNVTGRMPSHSMVSFSPSTSAYVREALRPANDPLRGGDDG